MLDKTDLYYFSPTGGTRKVAEILSQGLSEEVHSVDLGVRGEGVEAPESGTVVVAAPVFGGRIPAIAAERLRQLEGNGKKAVTVVVYGTRAYEDALLELNDIMREKGFQVVASAALIAQHSIVPEVGKGRPDGQDREEILSFAKKVLERSQEGTDSPVDVPGDRPYKAGMNMPVTPLSLPSCVQCGKCASVCPVGAIRSENGAVVTDPEGCMLCMACVAACPEHARILPPPVQEQMDQKLGALRSVRRENVFFL